MSSGNDALLDDYDEADSLDDVMRKSRDNFPKMCDSKNEAGEFDNSLHEARLKNYMERLAVACERRGFADGARLARSDLYKMPASYKAELASKTAKPPPAPPARGRGARGWSQTKETGQAKEPRAGAGRGVGIRKMGEDAAVVPALPRGAAVVPGREAVASQEGEVGEVRSRRWRKWGI